MAWLCIVDTSRFRQRLLAQYLTNNHTRNGWWRHEWLLDNPRTNLDSPTRWSLSAKSRSWYFCWRVSESVNYGIMFSKNQTAANYILRINESKCTIKLVHWLTDKRGLGWVDGTWHTHEQLFFSNVFHFIRFVSTTTDDDTFEWLFRVGWFEWVDWLTTASDLCKTE